MNDNTTPTKERAQPGRVLVYSATGEPVKRGDVAQTFRGERATVQGWSLPRTPESTGRVLIKIEGTPGGAAEYYPSVIDAEWRDAESAQV